MYTCEYCNKEHDGNYGSGRFCNEVCARGFSTKSKRNLINKKIKKAWKKKYNYISPLRGIIISKEEKDRRLVTRKKNTEKIKANIPFELWPIYWKIKYIFDKYKSTCQECGFNKTKENSKGPYEVHHIDGNHENWKEENLTLLCLNCHRLTSNWGFTGKKKMF